MEKYATYVSQSYSALCCTVPLQYYCCPHNPWVHDNPLESHTISNKVWPCLYDKHILTIICNRGPMTWELRGLVMLNLVMLNLCFVSLLCLPLLIIHMHVSTKCYCYNAIQWMHIVHRVTATTPQAPLVSLSVRQWIQEQLHYSIGQFLILEKRMKTE